LGKRPRFEPRNLNFADGLDRWDHDAGAGSGYSAIVDGSSAVLESTVLESTVPGSTVPGSTVPGSTVPGSTVPGSTVPGSVVRTSAVPRPGGAGALLQAIFADDYRGREVVFSAEISTEPLTGPAGLRLEILRHWRRVREDHGITVAGQSDWTSYEVRALVPADADIIRFGITLAGAGRIALRHPELRAIDAVR
jgi:hypothetical protein